MILLDLSAAFHIIDHAILLQWLQTTFGIDDSAHRWFQSYLSGQHQCVCCGSTQSTIIYLICGVPQGSVLGLVLFVLYTVELISFIKHHGLSPHLYANHTQVYGSYPPAAVDALSSQIIRVCRCHCDIDEIKQVAA